jgi:hypothetical protein
MVLDWKPFQIIGISRLSRSSSGAGYWFILDTTLFIAA